MLVSAYCVGAGPGRALEDCGVVACADAATEAARYAARKTNLQQAPLVVNLIHHSHRDHRDPGPATTDEVTRCSTRRTWRLCPEIEGISADISKGLQVSQWLRDGWFVKSRGTCLSQDCTA